MLAMFTAGKGVAVISIVKRSEPVLTVRRRMSSVKVRNTLQSTLSVVNSVFLFCDNCSPLGAWIRPDSVSELDASQSSLSQLTIQSYDIHVMCNHEYCIITMNNTQHPPPVDQYWSTMNT